MFDRGPSGVSLQGFGLLILAYMGGRVVLGSVPFSDLPALNLFAAMGLTLILVGFVVHGLRQRGQINIQGLGLVSARGHWYALAIPATLGTLILVDMASRFISQASQEEIQAWNTALVFNSNGGEMVLSLLTLCLFAPVLEEFIFRGALFGVLVVRLGALWALILSALIFAVAHTGVLASVTVLVDQLLLILALMIIGMVAGLMRYFSGSLYPAIALHAFYNASLYILSMSQFS